MTMKIERAREVESRLRAALAKAGRREIGGMLMGEQVAPDHFRIVDFSVDAFSGSRTHFRRDPQVHRKTLDEFFDRTGRDYWRFNYLGEWHSHQSFSVYPSVEDIETMTDLVENGSSSITFAVLLILRRLLAHSVRKWPCTMADRARPPHHLVGKRRRSKWMCSIARSHASGHSSGRDRTQSPSVQFPSHWPPKNVAVRPRLSGKSCVFERSQQEQRI
jgi:hypothetical protein